LEKLKGLLDGGNYLGIYKEPAKTVCEILEWDFDES